MHNVTVITIEQNFTAHIYQRFTRDIKLHDNPTDINSWKNFGWPFLSDLNTMNWKQSFLFIAYKVNLLQS